MTHHVQENELALYSTGDVDSSQLEYLEQHIVHCASCRQRLADFEYLQAIFLNLRAESSPNDVREVRTQVMQAIQNESKRHRIWKWAPAAAAAAIVAILLFRGNQEPATKNSARPPLAILRHAPEPALLPSASQHVVRAARRIHRRPVPGLRSIALLTVADHTPTIKITTSDPNVIILLPPDSSSHERTQTND